MSLRARLLAMFVAIIVLVAVTMGIYNFRLLEAFFRQSLANQLQTRLGPSVQGWFEQFGAPATVMVARQVANLAAGTTQSRILVTDVRGTIIVDTGADGPSLVGKVVPESLISRTLLQGRISTFDYPTAGADALAVSVPWISMNRLVGAVLVVRSVRTAARQTALEVSRYVFRAALLAFAVALVAAFFMSSSITGPLRRMAQAARSISKGNFSEKIEVRTEDELGHLAEAMNSMSDEISVLIQSLTQEKEKLQALMDARTTMMSDISHDLRTPVTSIRGFVEALRDGVIKDDTEKLRTLNVIHEESERLSRMVDDLFYLARLEAGEAPLAMKEVDIGAIVRSTVDTILPIAREKELEVNLLIDEEAAARGLLKAMGSADRLTRAILNLVDNAVKYSPHGGRVTVTVTRETEGALPEAGPSVFAAVATPRAVIAISDQGPGISEEDIKRIFERFYRADKARSRTKSGAGLGLSIARFIAEQHQGAVWAKSTVGQGSTFYMAIPLLS
ncbi:MAG: sensor histidine kinase [Bacillota bacterium]